MKDNLKNVEYSIDDILNEIYIKVKKDVRINVHFNAWSNVWDIIILDLNKDIINNVTKTSFYKKINRSGFYSKINKPTYNQVKKKYIKGII